MILSNNDFKQLHLLIKVLVLEISLRVVFFFNTCLLHIYHKERTSNTYELFYYNETCFSINRQNMHVHVGMNSKVECCSRCGAGGACDECRQKGECTGV